ncbi:MAG: hypothetical protein JO354_04695 [Verrucomicrobia bacterium]|nr:hypothetical protein [Verrucomicrobiota bacterium]
MLKNGAGVLVIIAAALFLAGIGFRSFGTSRGVPVLGLDACVFVPQAVTFRATGDLINPVWPAAKLLDPASKGRMVYHGFLFPMTLAWLMSRSDYLALIGSLALLAAVATILPALMFLVLARRWNWDLTAARWLLVLFLTIAAANYTQGSPGRPETLAAVILASGVIVGASISSRWQPISAALAIGLTTAVDPIVGVLAGFLFAGYAAWKWPARLGIPRIIVAAILALLTFGCCILLYPYSARDWLEGTLRMGRYAISRPVSGSPVRLFLGNYITSGSSWLIFLAIVLVLWTCWRIVNARLREQSRPQSPLLFVAVLILATAAVCRFVLYAPWTRYTFLPFMPIGYIAVFYELGRIETAQRQPHWFYRFCAIAILAWISLGFVLDLGTEALVLKYGDSLPIARAQFQAVRAEHPGSTIALSQYLFALTEDCHNVVFTNEANPPPPNVDLLILPQAFSAYLQPPVVRGFQLRENYFDGRSLFGIPLFRLGNRSYAFAVYARER